MKKILIGFLSLVLILGVTVTPVYATGNHGFNICDVLPWLPICNEEEPEDICPNIEGVQESMPEGYSLQDGQCVEDQSEEPVDYCDTLEGVQAEDADCPQPNPCEPELFSINTVQEIDPCPTPTEEPTPTEQPSQPGNPPTFAGSSTEAPGVCGDTRPSRVANINVVTTNEKGELEVQWALPIGADKVHIEYGLKQSAEHALLSTPNDGNEVIRRLKSGEHYWFRVAGVNGCAVGDYSDWFDPLVP